MKELKPCPFCGEAEDIDYGIYNGTMRGFDYVQCQNCGAEVRALHNCEWIAAEELWNRRAIDAEPTKYRWHDLRKNPNDLPKSDGEYYVYQYVYFLTSSDPNSERCEPAYCIDMFENGKFMNQYDGGELIAWRAIEPFEEEET